MAARDRRAFLHVAGCVEVKQKAEVHPWERELVSPQKISDHLFTVVPEAGDPRIEHVESLAVWNTREINAVLVRAITLSLVPEMPEMDLRTTVILLRRKNVPRVLPRSFRRRKGALTDRLVVRYVRVWRERAAEVLALQRPMVLPFVPLMRHDREEMDEAVRRVFREDDEELTAQFFSWAALIYTREELERYRMLFPRQTLQIARETWLGKDLIDEGVEKGLETGLAKGLAKGREESLAGSLRLLRTILAKNFPELAKSPAIDAIPDVDAANEIIGKIACAKSKGEAAAALRNGKHRKS